MQHSESNNTLGERLIDQIGEKLATAIASIESDEILQQMRNDQTLYEYKIDHIKELISSELNFSDAINEAIEENQKLKEENRKLQLSLSQKCRQFGHELDKIDESARQHTKIKQAQITKLSSAINELVEKNQILNKSLRKKELEINEMRDQLQKKQVENSQSQKGLEKVQHVLQRYETDHEETINHLQHQFKKQIDQYEAIIQKMQNDMNLIKNQWQKKCIDIENQLRNSYKQQLLALEEKKNRQLQNYIESCKEGKPIIIKEDIELATSKMEIMTQQYEAQISELQEKCAKLGIQNVEVQNEMNKKIKQFQLEQEKKKTQIKGVQEQLETIEIEKNTFRHQADRVTKDNEILKNRIEENHKKIKELQLKEDQLTTNVKDSQIEIERLTNEKERMKKQIQNLKQKSNQNMKQLRESNIQVEGNEAEIMKMKDEIRFMEKKLQISSRNYTKQHEENQMLQQNQKKLQQEVTELRRLIKNEKRQTAQLKQRIDQLSQQLKQEQIRYKDKEQKNQQKMAEMIDEFERINEKDHEEFQTLERQNERLKRQIKRNELLLIEKDKDIQLARETTINSQIEEVKRVCLSEVTTERQRYQRLLENHERKQRQHHLILQQTKNQVKDIVRLTTNKWGAEFARLEEEAKKKQRELLKFSQKLEMIVNEYQQTKKCQQYDQEDAKKMRKRYDIMKTEKEQKINDLLQRLQNESKHKLALEKELKIIRSQVNKVQPVRNQTEWMVSDRQNKNAGNTDRQKQLSQIRELIAKTYKAVGEKPESDHKWKRMQ